MNTLEQDTNKKIIIKKCHVCGKINESHQEVQKCGGCAKSFLPLNYFHKVHSKETSFKDLFCESHELHEEEMVKGICVIW